MDWFSDYVPPGQDPGEPANDIYYPLIDNLDDIELKDGGHDSPNHKFVGVLVSGCASSGRTYLVAASHLGCVFHFAC